MLQAKQNFVLPRPCQAATLHCAHASFNGCCFWDGPIVFQRLARLTTSKPPTSILWYATFDIPGFRCGLARVLKKCESHNLTSPSLTRATRLLERIESQMALQPNIAFAYNAPSAFGLLPGLDTRKSSDPGKSFLRGAFSLEKY